MEKRKETAEDPFTLIIKPEFRLEMPAVEESDDMKVPKAKKRRGQNKAKERVGSKAVDKIKLCFATANGESCEKENCPFSHDVVEYLKEKGDDIGDKCPNIDDFGSCKYGIKCRFYSAHLKGVSPTASASWSETEHTRNIISREIQKSIRSKSFPLSKSRDFERIWSEKGHDDKIEHVEQQSDIIMKLRSSEKKQLNFRGKLYLAPLTTVGNLPFRRICKGFGVDITCAEMALANNLLAGSQTEWSLLKRHASEDVFGVQITGNHPTSFTQLCEILADTIETDFVDINLGCPVEAITSKGCGSALMEKRSRLKGMILGANHVLNCPVTVKLRTGIQESKHLAHKLIPLFQDWGVRGVTLHGRSKAQRYSRLADWNYIAECSQVVDRNHTNNMFFFGNGDVFNPNDYLEKMSQYQKLDGIMIGRGALVKPWIFKEIKDGQLYDISASERLDILRDFAKFGMQHWGSDTQVNIIYSGYQSDTTVFVRMVVIPSSLRSSWNNRCFASEIEFETTKILWPK
jgi:tRNA-dihydrouridine synthase 3